MTHADRTRLARQAALLYGLTLVVTVGLTLLQSSAGWLRDYLLVLVAATFLYVPLEVLQRQGENPADLGIHHRAPLRALKLALLVMAITFPPYLVGFHLWQTVFLGKRLAVAEARYDHWPLELADAPRAPLPTGQVRLYNEGEIFRLQWRLPGEPLKATLHSDQPIVPLSTHSLKATSDGARLQGGEEGAVAFKVPGETLTVEGVPEGRLRVGAGEVEAPAPYQVERGLLWLLNLVLVQLLLVAWPEEVFYRGYLQSRLDGLIGRDRQLFGVPINLSSVLLTSALFAIGHLATIPNPARLAVFFPSLLFGWMRRASGGVMAPLLYHAACNLLVEVASELYA